MTILITGATGFVGRHLTAHLTAAGHSVIALLRHTDQLLTLRRQVAELGGQDVLLSALQGDLDHPQLGLADALPPLAEIVHLGARFGWKLPPDEARQTNVEGSLAVARLAQSQGCRLVFISGFMLANTRHLAELGIKPEAPDQTIWDQVYRRAGAYEASKLEGALRVRQFARDQQLDYVEVQPATVAGHSQTGAIDPTQPLYNLIDNLARGRLARVPGTPDHWLPLIPVDQLAQMIAAAALAPHPPEQLLALADDTPNLQNTLALVAKTLGRKTPTGHIPKGLLRLLLALPGMPWLMNTSPEALNFIQTTRFDLSQSEHFLKTQALPKPSTTNAVIASAKFYSEQATSG